MNAIDYFQGAFRLRLSTNGWYDFECPVCGKHKGAVNFDRGSVKCWRGCYHTSIGNFLHQVMGVDWATIKDIVGGFVYTSFKDRPTIKGLVSFPEGYQPLWSTPNMGMLHQRARQYIQERGFDPDVLGSEGWGFCDSGEYLGRIIIPYYCDGILRYYTGRTFIGDSLRYRNPATESLGTGKAEYLFNEDALKLGKTYLTEGAIDARTIGTNGVATGGWELSPTQLQKILDSPHPICLVPDLGSAPDNETYFAKSLKLGQILLQYGKEVSIINYSSLSSYGKDVNDIGWCRVQPFEYSLTFENIYG